MIKYVRTLPPNHYSNVRGYLNSIPSPRSLRLFSDYSNQQWSPDCWAAPYDFSGVAWETDRPYAHKDEQRVTLVGRNCYIGAWHWKPHPGDNVTFTDKFGSSFSYEITAHKQITILNGSGSTYNTDIVVGVLDQEVSPTLTSYKIADSITVGEFLLASRARNSSTVRYPTNQTMLWERFKQFSPYDATNGFIFTGDYFTPSYSMSWGMTGADANGNTTTPEEQEDHYSANSGDSGDPLFIARPTGIEVVGAYYSANSCHFLGYPPYLTEIDNWLTSQGTQRQAQKGIA